MALLSDDLDSDLIRLWGLVAELSEQLNANRALTTALQAQANQAKGQVYHSGTGFVLRRFNVDLSKEVFESELERTNASLSIENQTLLHENKQLNILLKEYEQTLETVMAKFRAQSHAAQQHELDLTRHYESLLLSRETNTLNQDLMLSSSQSESIARLAHYIRSALRSLAGDTDPEGLRQNYNENEDGAGVVEEAEDSAAPASAMAHILALLKDRAPSPAPSAGSQRPGSSASNRPRPEDRPDYREGGYSGTSPALEDWSLEREIEICRLEKENEELRRLLTVHEGMSDLNKDIVPSSVPYWSSGLGSPDANNGGLLASPTGSTSSLSGESSRGGLGFSRYGGAPLRQGLLAQNRAKIMLASSAGSRGGEVGSLLGMGGVGSSPGSGFGNMNLNGVGIHQAPGPGAGPFQLQLQPQMQQQQQAQSPFSLIQTSQQGQGQPQSQLQQQQQVNRGQMQKTGALAGLWGSSEIDNRGSAGYFKEFPT